MIDSRKCKFFFSALYIYHIYSQNIFSINKCKKKGVKMVQEQDQLLALIIPINRSELELIVFSLVAKQISATRQGFKDPPLEGQFVDDELVTAVDGLRYAYTLRHRTGSSPHAAYTKGTLVLNRWCNSDTWVTIFVIHTIVGSALFSSLLPCRICSG